MDEKQFEKLTEKRLNISTLPSAFEKDDKNHSRYEPTAYSVLERLAESGLIDKNDTLIDYGCGKGRVSFYLHYALGIRTIGIEYNERLYNAAQANLAAYTLRNDPSAPVFILENAENHIVKDETCFFFFNPFSEKILKSVLNRIFDSYYENPRRLRFFFYYPTDSYLALLMTEMRLKSLCDIDTSDLFETRSDSEKIAVFALSDDL